MSLRDRESSRKIAEEFSRRQVSEKTRKIDGELPADAFTPLPKKSPPAVAETTRQVKTQEFSIKNTYPEDSMQYREMRNSYLGEWGVNTWIFIILVPIIIWIILIFLVPSFVKEDENGHSKVDHPRVLLWTLLLSVIVWVVLYGLNRCKCWKRMQ